jgi:hypothetical protein
VQFRSTQPANVGIGVADGYDVSLDENATTARLNGTVDARVLLTGEGNLTHEDGTIEAHLAEAGGVLFQARPDAPGEQVIQRALEHAAEQDKLGGEARVAGADAEAVLSSGEARSSFHAEEAGEGLQVIVNLENFSEHDVTVQPPEDNTTDDTDEGTDGTDDTADDGADTAGDEAPAPSLAVLVAALAGLGALVRRP